jgi:hypothetical protein
MHDSAALFRRALDSVFMNSIKLEHALVVVDGPVGLDIDNVLNDFASREGLEILRLPANIGLASALNAGLEQVRTEWVVRADADDINVPTRFAIQAQFARANANLDLFGGAIDEYDAQGLRLARRTVPQSGADIRRRMPYRNPFNHMTMAFRASAVRDAGGYPQLHLREDYGLWARLVASGAQCANVPDVLVHATTGRNMYRRRGGWRYARSEIELQRYLARCGLKSSAAGAVHGVLRSFVFLLPAVARGWLYERALRTRVSASNFTSS